MRAEHVQIAAEHYRWAICNGLSHIDLLAAIKAPIPPEPDASYVLLCLAEASEELSLQRRKRLRRAA